MYEGGWDDEGWMSDERWEKFASDPRTRPAGFRPETETKSTSMAVVAPSPATLAGLVVPPAAPKTAALVQFTDTLVVYDFEEGKEEPRILATPEATGWAPTWRKLEELLGTVDVKAEDHQMTGVPDLECCIPVPLEYYREKRVHKTRDWKPLTCVFDSTSEYMRKMLGMDTHYTDKRFFENHPETDKGGVSLPLTAKIIQQIIEPYGLRVTRIRCHAGEFMPRGDLANWMQYLGCNPLGAQDARTTNEAFAKIAGVPLADVDKFFAFEFHDEPFRPSIVCEASKATTLSAAQGHASYLAPRSNVTSWWLSLQIGRGDWEHPTKPSYPTEYPDEHIIEPDLMAILRAVEKANQDAKANDARAAHSEVRS